MANYTLRQLKYFVTTVHSGSVAEASRKLYIAQPSISTAIKNLEDNFGLQLFIRHHAQGVSLTPSGKWFYKRVQKLLQMAHEFEQNVLADNDVISGKIGIGCFETVAPLILPKLIRDFKTCYPGVEINVRDGDQHELKQGLANGKFDLTLLYNHDLDNDMTVELLQTPGKPYVLLPAQHTFATRPSVSLENLADKPMILLDVLPSRKYFVSLFTKAGITPNIVFRSPSIEMVRGMVGQGFGFAMLVTRPYGEHSYDGQPLVTIELDNVVEGSDLVAAWLNRSPLTKLGQLFVEFCKDEFTRAQEIILIKSAEPAK